MPEEVGGGPAVVGLRRREDRRRGVRRDHKVLLSLSEAELGEVRAVAAQLGVSPAAFCAERVLEAVGGGQGVVADVPAGELRQWMRNLGANQMQIENQLRKSGTNLNQAVAKLHALGEVPGELAFSARRVDEAVAEVEAVTLELTRLLRRVLG